VRPDHRVVLNLVAAAALALLSACGGTAAAPTPTAVPPAPSGAVPAPSPQRPPLASPAASPSSVSVAAPTAAATVAATVAALGPDCPNPYEIQSGDTLGVIAQKCYGDPTQWRPIYDANKETIGSDPDKLKLGTKLNIPPKPS
jgi:nucleoid-associated protein YgaU